MLREITPPFIKKLDTFLLENYPVIWMSKIHFVLWHALIVQVLLGLLGTIVPFYPESRIPYQLWYALLTLVGVVMLCIWTYHYMIFNREKSYGIRRWYDEYLNFFLVFLVFLIFLLTPYSFEYALNKRVGALYSDKEIIIDINTLNKLDPYFLDSYQKYKTWTEKSTETEYFNLGSLNSEEGSVFTPYFMTYSSEYPEVYSHAAIVSEYRPLTNKKELTEKVRTFMNVAKKYQARFDNTAEYYAEHYLRNLEKEAIPTNSFSYGRSETAVAQKVIENVCDAKYFQLFIFDEDYCSIMFYVILSLSSLIYLFKMTYWRQFLLLAVVCAFYPILAFIISRMVSGRSSDDTFIYLLMLFPCLVIFSVVKSIKNKNNFQPFHNIMSQAFFLIWPYLAMMIVGFLKSQTSVFHPEYMHHVFDGETIDPIVYAENYRINALADHWHHQFDLWFTGALCFGMGSFFLALPFFKELFVKQLALPKKT